MFRKHSYFFLSLAVALCCSITPDSLLAKEVLARPLVANPGQSGFRKTGSMGKADSALSSAFTEFQAHAALVAEKSDQQGATPTTFRPSHRFVQFKRGNIEIEATAASNGQSLLDDLIRLGLQGGEKYGLMIAGKLPVAMIEKATRLDSLQSISAARAPMHNDSGAAPTPGFPQGDKALRALNARATHSVDGTGVTVAVISDTYDQSELSPLTDAAADITSGDLPAGNPVISGGTYTLCYSGLVGPICTDEGRAMLQIAYDLATGASLLFHTGYGGQVKFANAITALVDAGADIIVDDLSYLEEPMFQDGIIAQSIDEAVASGVTYFSAAGNGGRRSYQAPFEDSGEEYCFDWLTDGFCDPVLELVGPMHDFNPAPGSENINTWFGVTIPVGDTITIVFQWDDPFGSVHTGNGPQRDHAIILLDSTGSVQLAIEADENITNGIPSEVLQYTNDGAYGTEFNIVIAYDAVDSLAPPADLMKLVFYGSSDIILNGHTTDSSTVVGHANAAGAIAVGASYYLNTPEFSVTPPLLQSYSSAGGTPILFDTSGSALPAPVIRDKPGIVAVDGVSTTFFSSQQVGDALPDFFGTSAAAPHAAAVAALVMHANSTIPPWKIANALKTTAIDMGTAGFDFDSGYGLIQADAAVAAVLAVTADPSGLGATAVSASQVDLAWTDNSNNETGFDVERSPGGAATWIVVGSTGSNVSTFSDMGLASNTPYDYRVKATYNAGSDSGYSNTASVTTFDGCPAGPVDIPSGTWHMFSLPCDPSPDNKVTDVFSDQVALDYTTTWVVYRYDAGTDAYVQMLANSVMSEGVGYFVFVQNSAAVSISGFPFTPIDIPLIADGVDMQFNLLGHNRNGYVAWADVEIIDTDDGNAVYTLAQADPDLGGTLGLACAQEPTPHESCLMSREMYKWNGATYIMADGETSGLEGSLLPFDGFWVSAFRTGSEGIKLRIPTPSLPPLPSATAATADTTLSKPISLASTNLKSKKPSAAPWFIRLIAESEGKQDPGNVLGQMKTSTNGQDRHDLKEKYPFDTRYLSILFTNPEFEQTDWGFTSDFRKLGNKAKGRWDFVVKASPDVESVTLRWEGDTALFDKAYLLDVKKNHRIKASPDGSYTFDVMGEETPFVFILK